MLESIEGDESTGKTTLAYTAPTPIEGFSFDLGAERAIFGGRYEEHFAGLTIEMVPYDHGLGKVNTDAIRPDIRVWELPQSIQIDAIRIIGKKQLWAYFVSKVVAALLDSEVSTVVVDTMTLARRVKADAYLEGLQEANEKNKQPLRERLLQIEWGQSNDSIRDIWTTGAGTKKNLIGIHHLTDERQDTINANGQKDTMLTGKRILDGLTQTNRFVDVAIRMEKKGSELTGTLVKCGYSLGLEGTLITNPTWNKVIDLVAMSTGERIAFGRRA